jgi:hypothetical protein
MGSDFEAFGGALTKQQRIRLSSLRQLRNSHGSAIGSDGAEQVHVSCHADGSNEELLSKSVNSPQEVHSKGTD